MANRTVAVNFVANTAPYVAGVGKATAATSALGGAASMAIARIIGPAALVYGLTQAAKASLQFQDEMTKLKTQIGLTNPQIDEMRRAALGLGGATTKGPQELAEATFFIASAGLRGAAALDVLRSSAQLSAIGLGETKVIADLLTSAVNAYGEESLSAASASDALVSAVRLGKLEADSLAGAMGRVLPIASAMGVTFDEVGGIMAAMSKTGTDAATAATQLRAIMVSLLKPAQQSRDAMHNLGFTVEGLQETIMEDGLFAALLQLHEAADGNTAVFGELFPNVRALAGVMDLLGPQLEGNVALMDEMARSAGVASEAFEVFAGTTRAEMQRASAEIQRAQIGIGDRTEGIVFNLARVLRLTAQAVGDSAARSEDAMGFTLTVARDLTGALRNIANETRGLSDADREAAMSSDAMRRQVDAATEAYSRLTLQEQGNAFTKEVRMALMRGQIGIEDELTDAFLRQAIALELASDEQSGVNADAARWNAIAARYVDSTDGATSALDALADQLGLTAEEFEAATKAIDENRRAQLALVDPMYAAVRAQREYQEALAELTRLQGDAEASSDDLVDAIFDVMIAEIERQAAMEGAGLVTEGFLSSLNETASELGLTEDQLRTFLSGLKDLGIEFDLLDGKIIQTQHVHTVSTVIEGMPTQVPVGGLSVPDFDPSFRAPTPTPRPTPTPAPRTTASGLGGSVLMRARGGPVMAGGMYMVGEEGPELFRPAMAGSIVPAGPTQQMLSGGGSGITIQSYNTYRSADDQALLQMLEMAQQAGRL
jgi:TP901 family phage tail tape measure protein